MGAAAGSMRGGIDPDALALFARMTVPPSTKWKGAINTLIVGAKAQSIYSKLKMFYLIQVAETQQAGFLDWVRNTSGSLSGANISFSSEYGLFYSGAAGSYFDTNFKPYDYSGGSFTYDNYMMGGMFSKFPSKPGIQQMLVSYSNSPAHQLNAFDNNLSIGSAINPTSVNGSVSDGIAELNKILTMERNGTAVQTRKSGSTIKTGTGSATAFGSNNIIKACTFSAESVSGGQSMIFASEILSPSQIAAFETLINDYITTMTTP